MAISERTHMRLDRARTVASHHCVEGQCEMGGLLSRIRTLTAALEQCEEYFDNRSDVKDGDYGVPEPNTEMRLLSEVREALAR